MPYFSTESQYYCYLYVVSGGAQSAILGTPNRYASSLESPLASPFSSLCFLWPAGPFAVALLISPLCDVPMFKACNSCKGTLPFCQRLNGGLVWVQKDATTWSRSVIDHGFYGKLRIFFGEIVAIVSVASLSAGIKWKRQDIEWSKPIPGTLFSNKRFYARESREPVRTWSNHRDGWYYIEPRRQSYIWKRLFVGIRMKLNFALYGFSDYPITSIGFEHLHDRASTSGLEKQWKCRELCLLEMQRWLSHGWIYGAHQWIRHGVQFYILRCSVFILVEHLLTSATSSTPSDAGFPVFHIEYLPLCPTITGGLQWAFEGKFIGWSNSFHRLWNSQE